MPTATGNGQDDRAYNLYIALANRLADHFDVPRVVAAGTSGGRRRGEPIRKPTDRLRIQYVPCLLICDP